MVVTCPGLESMNAVGILPTELNYPNAASVFKKEARCHYLKLVS
jgi:hypothetical protein